MNKLLVAISVVAIFTGCYKTEYSGTLTEKGKVIDCFFTPGQVTHSRTTTITNNTQNSIFNDYDDDYDDDYNTSYSGRKYKRQRHSGPQIYYSDAVNEIPAKYGVMFECEHSVKFVIEGTKEKHKSLWQRMKKDSTVTIFYREIYHVDTKTGQKSLFDFDFLDAK